MCTLVLNNYFICRLFAEKFSRLNIDLEGVLSMMAKHPQYGCVSQIKEQLASDGPVSKSLSHTCTHTYMYIDKHLHRI